LSAPPFAPGDMFLTGANAESSAGLKARHAKLAALATISAGILMVSWRASAWRLAQSVQDDLEQVPGSGIPFVLLEPGQVAEEEDDVTGVDVRADGPVGFAGVEEQCHRFTDGPQAVRGEVLRYCRFDGTEDPRLTCA